MRSSIDEMKSDEDCSWTSDMNECGLLESHCRARIHM